MQSCIAMHRIKGLRGCGRGLRRENNPNSLGWQSCFEGLQLNLRCSVVTRTLHKSPEHSEANKPRSDKNTGGDARYESSFGGGWASPGMSALAASISALSSWAFGK